MPDFLRSIMPAGDVAMPATVLWRLVGALVLGAVVAGIYRATRRGVQPQRSFAVTLILLSILIAMVTQVIGDNVARAFSLVGALSIVRFRTVVRDTEDTAYVIFAVVVGMAAGASDVWVAGIGVCVVALAAAITAGRRATPSRDIDGQLTIRMGLDPAISVRARETTAKYARMLRVSHVATVKQGTAVEETFDAVVAVEEHIGSLVRDLNSLDGVQEASFTRSDEASGDGARL